VNKKLLTNSLIFFAGTIILSVFNYLYNAFMGRLLGPAEYSVIGSLLAFISIITIPTNAVATATMRFTAHYHAIGEDGLIRGFLNSFTRKLIVVGIVVAILLAILSGPLANFLHLPSVVPVIIIAPLLITAILLPVNRGILQGLQWFIASITNQGIDAVLKLILGVALVKVGFGINGAVGALVLSSITAYAASFYVLKPIIKHKEKPIIGVPQEIKEFSTVALVAFLLATLLMNIDILLVKHYFDPYQAGLYTALSTIGKIILFVTTPVVTVMFPMISDLQGRNEKHYRVLFQSMLLVLVISLCGVGGYYLLPHLVVNILYGATFAPIIPYLGLFGVVMLLYSLINLWINYFLSIGDKLFIWPLLISPVVEILLLVMYHNDFTHIVLDLLAAMVVGFVTLTGYYLYLKREQLVERLQEGGIPRPQ
jgi:O-antigen/teichoic acid export membrane protein